jgi:hypothetical protein
MFLVLCTSGSFGRNVIHPEEKAVIRQALVSMIREDSNLLAMQQALLIGVISRSDFPREWYDSLLLLYSFLFSLFSFPFFFFFLFMLFSFFLLCCSPFAGFFYFSFIDFCYFPFLRFSGRGFNSHC